MKLKKRYSKRYAFNHFPNAVQAARKIVNTLSGNSKNIALLETPERFISGMLELTWGQRVDELEFLKSLPTNFEVECDEMISITNLNFVSICEHHLFPIIGKVKLAYIPDGDQVIGLSKLARIVEFYAARPQTQERMTRQISKGLASIIPTKGVAVQVEAEHLCMSIRGIKVPGTLTTTSSLLGAFMTNKSTREEFLAL